MNLPATINWLAVIMLTQEGDWVHANMSLYRDSNGDRQWQTLPWDENYTFGQLFGVNHIVANEDAVNSHPLMGASGMNQTAYYYNRVPDAMFDVPEIREMYLRRLRTLMDQLLQPPGTPAIAARFENVSWACATYIAVEAALDRAKWGWTADGMYRFGQIGPSNAVSQILTNYLPTRRAHLYVTHCITNAAKPFGYPGYTYNAGIPFAQPANALLEVWGVEAQPGLGQPGAGVCVPDQPRALRPGPLGVAARRRGAFSLQARHGHAVEQRALRLARTGRLPRPNHRAARRAGALGGGTLRRPALGARARRCG